MSDPKDTRATLAKMLALTQDEELDCTGFAQHLAALVEDKVEPELRVLLDHHREICPECEEEREALARALAPDEQGD